MFKKSYSQKYKFIYLFCISNLIQISSGFSQNDREVVVKRSLAIECLHPTYVLSQCNYGLLIPKNIPGKQEVLEYKYPGIKPHHFNKNESNEYYVVWENIGFPALKKANLEISLKMKLHKYDLETAKKLPIIDKSDQDTNLYLKDEENFRIKAKNIQEASAKINGVDREETAKNIFNYVINSLDYHIFFDQDRGAKKALKDGRGDCTEYSELMVTLCRAKSIPARIVMGLIPHSNGSVGHHNWVEVYFPKYGWVAFDPTWADHPKATTTFYSMKNTYVQLSYKRYNHTVISPCNEAGMPVTIILKDTCIDYIGKKTQEMLKYYNNYQLEKATLLLDTLLNLEPDNSVFWEFKGMVNARQANYDKAYQCIQNAIKNAETSIEKAECLYGLSNYYALKAEADSAIICLQESINLGFHNYKQLAHDTDFYRIKNYPPFIKIVDELKLQSEKKPEKKN